MDKLNEARARRQMRVRRGALLTRVTRSRRVARRSQEVLYPLLSRLVQQPFFRYFKVNLYCDCPLWCAPLPAAGRAGVNTHAALR